MRSKSNTGQHAVRLTLENQMEGTRSTSVSRTAILTTLDLDGLTLPSRDLAYPALTAEEQMMVMTAISILPSPAKPNGTPPQVFVESCKPL